MATPPIRPPIVPPGLAGAPAQRADAAKLAAQQAFFDLAMGRAAAAKAPPPTVAAASAPAPKATPQPSVQIPSEPPQRILRPGSILDIRV